MPLENWDDDNEEGSQNAEMHTEAKTVREDDDEQLDPDEITKLLSGKNKFRI